MKMKQLCLSLILALSLLMPAVGIAQSCPAGPAPTITSASSVTLTEGVQGAFTFTGTGGPAPNFSETGTLPAGVGLVTNGISGIPSVGSAGTYTLQLTATNGVLPNASKAFTIVVLEANTPPPPPPPDGPWVPAVVTSWQWQIGAQPNFNNLLSVQMYDVDGENTSAANVASMHSKGIHAVCYISAGTWENWRDDQGQFLASDKGKGNGWPGEKWLDIRSSNVHSIMTRRIQACKDKGFDALEPDNIDGYSNSTGFPLTSADQLTYNKFLADTAHSMGLSIALKNDPEQAKALQPSFDFAIEEECTQYNECGSYSVFTAAGKAVFGAEYSSKNNPCAKLNQLNFNGAIFDGDLTGKRTACR